MASEQAIAGVGSILRPPASLPARGAFMMIARLGQSGIAASHHLLLQLAAGSDCC
jgi:hypothetical protein